MAFKTNELYSEYDGENPPSIDAHRIIPVKAGPAAAVMGEQPEYLLGTLMAYDTANDYWVAWDPAGANGVEIAKGVLWPDRFTPDDTDDSITKVMVMGTIRFRDLLAGVGVTATSNQIRDAVNATFRELGIIVQDLDTVR